jgi:hypothetical protein
MPVSLSTKLNNYSVKALMACGSDHWSLAL